MVAGQFLAWLNACVMASPDARAPVLLSIGRRLLVWWVTKRENERHDDMSCTETFW